MNISDKWRFSERVLLSAFTFLPLQDLCRVEAVSHLFNKVCQNVVLKSTIYERTWGEKIKLSTDVRLAKQQFRKACQTEINWRRGRYQTHTLQYKSIVFEQMVVAGNGLLVSIHEDNTIRLWNLSTYKCEHVFEKHRELWLKEKDYFGYRPRSLRADGDYLLSSCHKVVCVWELIHFTCLLELSGLHDPVALHSGHLAYCNDKLTIRIMNLSNLQLHNLPLTGHKERIWALKMNDKYLVSDSQNEIRVWDWKQGTCLHILSADHFKGLCLLGDQLLNWPSYISKAHVWNLKTGLVTSQFDIVHGESDNRGVLTNQNQLITTNSNGVCLWDMETGSLITRAKPTRQVCKMGSLLVVYHDWKARQLSIIDPKKKDSFYVITHPFFAEKSRSHFLVTPDRSKLVLDCQEKGILVLDFAPQPVSVIQSIWEGVKRLI